MEQNRKFSMKLQDVTNVTTLKKYLAERGSPWMTTPTTTFFQSIIPSRYFRWVGDGVVFISSERYPHCDRHYAVRKLMELPDGWPFVAPVSGNYPNLKMATDYAHKVVAEYRAKQEK